MKDAVDVLNKKIEVQQAVAQQYKQDAERWQWACKHWHHLVKAYMRSGFEAPGLEDLVEFWSQQDTTMEGEK